MELLFHEELKRSISGAQFQGEIAQLLSAHSSQVSDVLSALNVIQVGEPESAEFGFVASSVSFTIAKLFDSRNLGQLSPAIIAELLAKSVEGFATTIGGGGFINGDPSPELVLRFFNEASLQQFPYAAQSLPVSWDTRYIQRALNGADGEEARTLCNKLQERQGGKLSRDDAVQLLALLGDRELEAAPHLRGYGGRNNIPWYLRQFFEATGQLRADSPVGTELMSAPLFTPLVSSLLHFRGRFRTHIEQQRPERALRATVILMSEFFSIYNRPEIRADLEKPGLGRMVTLARELAFHALNCMNLPCEVPARVL